MLNSQAPVFKAIYAGVRPARIVTLIDVNDKEWVDTCFRVIEWYSQMWGGQYNLMIPTDGDSIQEEFWFLTEAFDPDYIFIYQKTMLDLKLSSPQKYSSWLEKQVENFVRENPGSERESVKTSIDGQIQYTKIDAFSISDSLTQDTSTRLNPFHSDGGVGHFVHALDGVPYPLTSLTAILPNSNVSTIYDLQVDSSKIIRLIIYSISGLLSSLKTNLSKQIGNAHQLGHLRTVTPETWELEDIEGKIEHVEYAGTKLENLLRFIWSEERKRSGVGNLFECTPFSTAMVGLRYYYRGHPELWRTPGAFPHSNICH